MSGTFRPLRPRPSRDSSDSPSGTQTSASSSSGLVPQAGVATSPPNAPRPKRHQIGVACSACQRRKTKCDGIRPICSMCQRKGSECVYDSEGDQRRTENLKRSNLALTERVDDFKFLVDFLRDCSDQEAAEVLRRIRASKNIEETVRFIKDSSLLLQPSTSATNRARETAARSSEDMSLAPRPGNSPPAARRSAANMSSHDESRSGYVSPEQSSTKDAGKSPSRRIPNWFMTAYEREEAIARSKQPAGSIGISVAAQARRAEELQLPSINSLTSFQESPIRVPAHPWTRVTDDNRLVSHLISLYFTWEHGHHRVVEKSAFLRDMNSIVEGDPSEGPPPRKFCSSLLVNAVLSVSCHLYFSAGGARVFDNIKDYGRRFFQEAERLSELEGDENSLTTLQALFLMLYDSFLQGATTLGSGYRRAIRDMYIRLDLGGVESRPSGYREDEGKREDWNTLSQAIWGLYCTDTIFALSCGWLPLLDKPAIERTFEPPAPEAPDMWQPYPLSPDKQPSLLHEVLLVSLDVVDIIREVLVYSHNHSSENQLDHAASIYQKLLGWKGSLPDKLLPSFSTLPCILLLHVQYDAAIVCLLRAFLDNNSGVADLNGDNPRSICLWHAIDAMSTIWIFRAMYGLGVSHSMLACISAGFSLVFYCTPGDLRSEAFLRACIALHEMSFRFPPCGDMLLGIRALVNRYRIKLPPHCAQYLMAVTTESRMTECDVRVPAGIPKQYRAADEDMESGAWLGGIDELLRSVDLSAT